MKRRFKVLLSMLAIGAMSLFVVAGASCGTVDWVEEKFDQLTCPHETTDAIDAVDATCLEDGHSQYEVCIDCGWEVVAKKVEKATGHQTEVVKGKAATCTEMGLSDGAVCKVCEEVVTEQKFTPALGHNKVELKAVAPTCTKTGLTAGIACDNEGCGKIFVEQQVVETVDHRYYKGVCRDCDITYEDAIKSNYTWNMQQVEVQVGDSIGGGYYRLYGVSVNGPGDEYSYMATTGNELGFGIDMGKLVLYVGIEAFALPSDSGIVVLSEFDTVDYYMDIYIPDNVTITIDGGTFVIDGSTKLVRYSSGSNGSHVSGCLFKLVDEN